MFDLNFFKQKSPQQRFLFILGLCMITIFIGLAIMIAFFGEMINLDAERFPKVYRYAFAIILVVYSIIRFNRITSKKDS